MNALSPTTRSPLRFVTAAAAALALSLGAYAAGTQSGPGPDAGPAAGWHHHGGFMMEKQLADLHTRLKLTPDQDKLWQSALDTMKRDRAAARVDREKIHAQLKTMMQQPILDMNALHAAHMQTQQDGARLREETATAWLAAYNALDDQQKTMVSDMFKQRFSRMESIREHMHKRWEQRQGAASEAAPANQ
ncbi:periplasmic heavy metal sensor [Trinickia soli]|uniref:periplasmic heavy metal sensor n=1 Tax=Trinickia soli TaxID=380675 RepID=UPI001259695C|nr:periplasmic heavy metal sensor [Paraburkholderia sp. T12-10]